jgi:hypothetical protein
MRRNQANRDVANANQQAQASQAQGLQRYDQAYAACMAQRGYQVR